MTSKQTRKPRGHWQVVLYAAGASLIAFLVASGWITEEEYTLHTVVDAPLDDVFALLTNVSSIAEVHPHLRGVVRVIEEQRHPFGAIIEWELQTSAMWAPPWYLRFLREIKTNEHVSTVATLSPGKSGRIQNVGLKGRRDPLFCSLMFCDFL